MIYIFNDKQNLIKNIKKIINQLFIEHSQIQNNWLNVQVLGVVNRDVFKLHFSPNPSQCDTLVNNFSAITTRRMSLWCCPVWCCIRIIDKHQSGDGISVGSAGLVVSDWTSFYMRIGSLPTTTTTTTWTRIQWFFLSDSDFRSPKSKIPPPF